MKLNRRAFLKAVAATAAGTALARVAGVAEAGEGETSTTSYQPVVKDRSTLSYELLKPFMWSSRLPRITTSTCASIPFSSDVVLEIATGYVDTEFDSPYDLGLGVGDYMPASLTLEQGSQLSFCGARGNVRLRGITAGLDEVIYHYYFWGHEAYEAKECSP